MAIYSNQIGLNITEERLQLIEIVFENNEYLIENVDEEYFEELEEILILADSNLPQPDHGHIFCQYSC